jgi:hypothetical protein
MKKIIIFIYTSERIIQYELQIERRYLIIIAANAPREGWKEDTDFFYEKLQNKLTIAQELIILYFQGILMLMLGRNWSLR